jgi:hypothetical protein
VIPDREDTRISIWIFYKRSATSLPRPSLKDWFLLGRFNVTGAPRSIPHHHQSFMSMGLYVFGTLPPQHPILRIDMQDEISMLPISRHWVRVWGSGTPGILVAHSRSSRTRCPVPGGGTVDYVPAHTVIRTSGMWNIEGGTPAIARVFARVPSLHSQVGLTGLKTEAIPRAVFNAWRKIRTLLFLVIHAPLCVSVSFLIRRDIMPC